MKKLSFLLLFALISVMASAQNVSTAIVGEWQCDAAQVAKAMGEQMTSATLSFSFHANKSGKLVLNASANTVEQGMNMEMSFVLNLPFTWTANGNTLTVKPNASTASISFTRCVVNGEDYSAMLPMLNESAGGAIKSQIATEFGSSLDLKNVTFGPGNKSFTCNSKGEKITCYRK